MAKLSDLRTLLEARRKDPAAGRAPGGGTAATGRSGSPVAKRPASPPLQSKRKLAAAKHADGDVDLAEEFADVRRIKAANKADVAGPRPAPIPRQRHADERDALEASKYGAEPSPQSWDIGQEHEGEQTFLRRGLGTDVLAKLRRGHWSVQGEIDLHGMITPEAHDALADFLLEARARGHRCVRVIHGKGLTSYNKEPVLKGKVRKWLSHWDEVLAYCEAQRQAGGGGAVIVLLRGR